MEGRKDQMEPSTDERVGLPLLVIPSEAEANPLASLCGWRFGIPAVALTGLFVSASLLKMQTGLLVFGIMTLVSFLYLRWMVPASDFTPWHDKWLRISFCAYAFTLLFSVIYPAIASSVPVGNLLLSVGPAWHATRGILGVGVGWILWQRREYLFFFFSLIWIVLLVRLFWVLGILWIHGLDSGVASTEIGNRNVWAVRLIILAVPVGMLCAGTFREMTLSVFWRRAGICVCAFLPLPFLHPDDVAPLPTGVLYIPFLLLMILAVVLRHVQGRRLVWMLPLGMAYGLPILYGGMGWIGDGQGGAYLGVAIAAFTMAAASWRVFHHGSCFRNGMLLAVLPILGVAVFASRSNQAILAFLGLSGLGVVAFVFTHWKCRRVPLVAYVLVFLVVLVVAVSVYRPVLFRTPMHSLSQRAVVWSETWGMIREGGVLFGAGYGYRHFQRKWAESERTVPVLCGGRVVQEAVVHDHAHNIILQILFERGVVGLAAAVLFWLCALAYALGRGFKALRENRFASLLGILFLFAFPVLNSVDYMMWGTQETLLWIVLGAVLFLSSHFAQEVGENVESTSTVKEIPSIT